MRRRHRLAWLLLGLILLSALVPWPIRAPQHERTLVGRVVDRHGPVAGARVAWQGDRRSVLSDPHGAFRLPMPRWPGQRATATKAGYRIAAALPVAGSLELRLEPLPAFDNEAYRWLAPHRDPDVPDNCANCHEAIEREWRGSAHARSARNPRVLELIAAPDGTALASWDLSRTHPLGVGVCASCHAPTLDPPDGDDDLRHARGVAADGVHCDYCHKIVDAPTDRLGVRFGRDGFRLLRPVDGESLTFGPLPDAVRPGESFGHLPWFRESRACASCHEGIVFGVPVYTTYSEWLASPARAQGLHCQSCHMAPTGTLTNVAPGHGGIEREPHTLASHRFPGSQAELLKRSLSATVTQRAEAGGWRVDVAIRADQVGHRVPTGFIDRHLVLRVQAFAPDGTPVALTAGPRLPESAGTWFGQPGWLYGKSLHAPGSAAPQPFWLPGLTLTDTRLFPGQPDHRSFVFAAPPARLIVQLWYRRFWPIVANARRWPDNDLLILEQTD